MNPTRIIYNNPLNKDKDYLNNPIDETLRVNISLLKTSCQIIITHKSRHRINRLPNGVMDTHHINFEGLKTSWRTK